MGRLLWDETVLSLCSRIARPKKGLDRRAQWREEPSHPICIGRGRKGLLDACAQGEAFLSRIALISLMAQ